MQTALKVIEYIITGGIDIFIFVLFFLSMKKCFWEEGRSKVGLFFLTLFAYPMQWFFISTGISLVLSTIGFMLFEEDPKSFSINGYYFVTIAVVATLFFILTIALCIFIVMIWLKFKNKAPFIFLYITSGFDT